MKCGCKTGVCQCSESLINQNDCECNNCNCHYISIQKKQGFMIDLVFTKELGKDPQDFISRQLTLGKYQVIQAEPDIPVTYETSPEISSLPGIFEANLYGLTCKSCVQKVTTALEALSGIRKCEITVKKAAVDYDTAILCPQDIISAIQNAGYGVYEGALPTDVEIVTENHAGYIHRSTFIIGGMSCTSCVASIEANLRKLPGIDFNSLSVTLLPPQAVISHNAAFLTTDGIIKRIEEMGFDASLKNSVSHNAEDGSKAASVVNISIEGMSCSSCVNSIESFLKEQGGIVAASVNLLTASAVVEFDSSQIGVRDIINLIEEIGFAAKLKSDNSIATDEENKELQNYLKDTILALFFVIPAFAVSMIFMMLLPHNHPINQFFMKDVIPGLSIEDLAMLVLSTPVQFWLALGTTVSYLFSIYSLLLNISYGKHLVQQFFETSIFLIFFILVGKSLEVFAKGKTTDAIRHLLTLTPDTAMLVAISEEDPYFIISEQIIEISLVQVGDILKVLPGGKIPTDGLVFNGSSYVDESMLTGESLPIYKSKGSLVFAGTVNQSNVMFIKVAKTGSETTLARIINLVQEAQSARAPIQVYADKISAVFVPAVLGIAALTWLGWMSAFEFGFIAKTLLPVGRSVLLFATEHAISVLVIACPCALGLATPTAVMVGSGVAAKLGILIKGGGAALETSYSVKTMVFDKTGTLTMGTPQVTDAQLFDLAQFSINTDLGCWKLLSSLESNSDHPLGKAICEYFRNNFVESAEEQEFTLSEISEKSGRGLAATVQTGEKRFYIYAGNERWIKSNGCDSNRDRYQPIMDRWKLTGKSIVMVGISEFSDSIPNVTDSSKGSVVAVIGISDQIRPEAPSALAALQARGIDVWMLTGDHDTTARAVASQIGILPNHIISQVLPEEKYQKVKELQLSSKGKVAMVGDGINDSVALAQADIGIALGSGSDIAIEAAQVILIKANLLDVLTLLDLSHKTFNRIKLNFGWAFGFNIIGIPLAAGCFYFWGITLSPMFAGMAMALSSVSVITSSLLLRFYHPPKPL
ncbi:serine/threonine protein kinase Ran1 [Terramyces sp. JEL0728]|nr:serine/threonine protein kinase Ran1 [Terramyces sp. JEL0728]